MTKAMIAIFLSSILSLSAMAYESYAVRTPDEPEILRLELPEDIGQEVKERRGQMNEKGYYATYSENAIDLIKFKNKKATAFSENGTDPWYENLRRSPSEFKLTFPFVGISTVDADHLLGFVPSGTAEGTSLDDTDWTGVTAYFMDDHLGTCRFVVFDMPAQNGQSIYDSIQTTYEINGKPTTKDAEGNHESGFLYRTSWTGKRYEKALECANKKPFDKQLLDDLVAYAKKIDNDLPDTP